MTSDEHKKVEDGLRQCSDALERSKKHSDSARAALDEFKELMRIHHPSWFSYNGEGE
jgi:hypothetical protein